MEKEEQIYRDLQKHMDSFPVGYPATASGVEIRLLKHFFTPEEARIATYLSITPQTLEQIYESVRETGISPGELKNILDGMERKVVITTITRGSEKLYRNSLFVVGLYESLVNRLTPEFLTAMGQYSTEGFGKELSRASTSQMRTIPVGKSLPLPDKYLVSTYDNVRDLIQKNTGQFAVANCICQQVMELRGERCKVTDLREKCLILNGEQYINAGLARPITKEETLDILEKAQEAGLVLQPLNSQQPWAICCCCGDCCGILRNFKQLPRPADFYTSNFYAEIDPDLCTGCQICIERCQMDAPFMTDGVASINLDRCIGCGNCVVTCDVGAVSLRKKETEIVPPKDDDEMLKKIAAEKESQ
jgi:ferredoxin